MGKTDVASFGVMGPLLRTGKSALLPGRAYPDSDVIPLKPLNILIGPNGSGKSNFLEAFALLQAAPGQLNAPIREGGGVGDWLWKGGERTPRAQVEIVTEPLFPHPSTNLRYRFSFTESGKRFEIVDECLENAEKSPGESDPYFFYRYQNNHPVLNVKSENDDAPRPRNLRREDVDPDLISQLADALRYASQHTQVVVTTHSEALVDAFTKEPDAILVCEKTDGCTSIQRLDADELRPWLAAYRLGPLWTSGQIGGNRW